MANNFVQDATVPQIVIYAVFDNAGRATFFLGHPPLFQPFTICRDVDAHLREQPMGTPSLVKIPVIWIEILEGA